MKRTILPTDSAINLWVEALSITELPLSYQILCGLSAIGCLLKRNVYIDNIRWKVFPNMSLMLVGPSGIGKDIVIGTTASLIRTVGGDDMVITGKTMEYLKHQLLQRPAPATCYTPAAELTAFLGGKDYQKSMVQELTDLLSTGDYVDVSTKGEGKKFIIQPTITMHAGSTEAWLMKAMPEGSLEGGFLPRFVVICEDYPDKNVAWVKYDHTKEENDTAENAKLSFYEFTKDLINRFSGRGREMVPDEGAKNFYTNWYCNRFKYFSSLVRPYANRSRDHVHRLAMLMALSRGHGWLEQVDYEFAVAVMHEVAASIDSLFARLQKEKQQQSAYRTPWRGGH